MTSKKKRLGNHLSSLLEIPPLPISLEKLVGSPSLTKESVSSSQLDLGQNLSLEMLAKDLGSPQLEESMDLFIDKYGSTNYSSLDELLESSLEQNQLVTTYTAPIRKDSDNLFDGLGDLLDL